MPGRHGSQSSNLDLLRATAVLLVVFGHFIGYSGFHNPLFDRWKSHTDQLANFAVLMFFIHTSLVLMMSLDRLRRSVHDGLTRRFYVRRAARIYPLAVLIGSLCYGFHIPRFPGQIVCGGGAFERLSNLALFQNLTNACVVSGPLWSLPYEVQMYLILPAAYLLGMRLRRPLAMLGLGFVLWYVSRKAIPGDLLRFAPWFAMGIYAFFRRPRRTLPSWTFAVALFCLLAAAAAIHRYVHVYASGWLLFGIGAAFCHLLPMFEDVKQWYIVRPATFIAKYSYGIYLVHAPLMWLVFARRRSGLASIQIGGFLLLVVGCSVLLYHLIEQPMIRLGVRISKPRLQFHVSPQAGRPQIAPEAVAGVATAVE